MRLLRVVIVDDEPPARDKLRRWLAEQSDMEVVADVGDGITAAQVIAAVEASADDIWHWKDNVESISWNRQPLCG